MSNQSFAECVIKHDLSPTIIFHRYLNWSKCIPRRKKQSKYFKITLSIASNHSNRKHSSLLSYLVRSWSALSSTAPVRQCTVKVGTRLNSPVARVKTNRFEGLSKIFPLLSSGVDQCLSSILPLEKHRRDMTDWHVGGLICYCITREWRNKPIWSVLPTMMVWNLHLVVKRQVWRDRSRILCLGAQLDRVRGHFRGGRNCLRGVLTKADYGS